MSKGINKVEGSPKLKEARAKIEAILKEADIAGVVVLHEVSHTEFFMVVDPSYSLAFLHAQTLQLKERPIVRLDDPLAATRKVIDTVNMLANLQAVTQKVTAAMFSALMYARQFYNLPTPKQVNGNKPTKDGQ